MLLGIQEFKFKEVMKTKTSMLKKPTLNEENKALEVLMDDMHFRSRAVLRYEEVEQTNTHVTISFNTIEFDQKCALFMRVMRNRSLGDFVEVVETDRMKYLKSQQGCTWKDFS